jgi:hypothetical protein
MHGINNVNNWIDVCITVLAASVFEGSCINLGWVSKERLTAHIENMIKFVYYFCFRLLRICDIGVGLINM